MNWFRENVALLRRNNQLWIACIMIAAFIACMTLAVMEPKWDIKVVDILCALFNLVMLMDMIDTSKKNERRAELTRLLADKCDEVVILKGEINQLEEKVAIYKAVKGNKHDNPIKSNRIVSDKTFAVRLRNLAAAIRPCDATSEEELDYFKTVAERLLKWQTKTVRKESDEYKYLERLGLMPQPSVNTEEHTDGTPKEEKSKRRIAPKRKPKTETENENKD